MKYFIIFFAVIISFNANAGTWFNDAEAFVGYDTTNYSSAFCEEGTGDVKGTSNMGARLNTWESESKRWRIGVQYTHLSCIFGRDYTVYNAIGVQATYTFWSRKR